MCVTDIARGICGFIGLILIIMTAINYFGENYLKYKVKRLLKEKELLEDIVRELQRSLKAIEREKVLLQKAMEELVECRGIN